MKSIYVIPAVIIGFPLITIMLYFGIGFQSFPVIAVATLLLTAIEIIVCHHAMVVGQFPKENPNVTPTISNVDKWIKER